MFLYMILCKSKISELNWIMKKTIEDSNEIRNYEQNALHFTGE